MQSQACGFEWTPLWHFVVIIIFIYLFSWFSEENIWISSCRSLLILAVLEDFHLEDAVVWLCRLKLMVICTNWCTKFWSQVVFWHLSTSLVIAICAITCWFSAQYSSNWSSFVTLPGNHCQSSFLIPTTKISLEFWTFVAQQNLIPILRFFHQPKSSHCCVRQLTITCS